MENKTKNILFRLGLSVFLLINLTILVLLVVQLFTLNNENEYLINIIGMIGVGVFVLIELVMLLVNLTKQIIFHAVVFNEHNSTINWPAFIVANIGLAIGLTLSIVGGVLYFTTSDLVIKTSVMVLIPIGLFLLFNCIAYNVYVLMFKVKKVNLKDLINK